jgi:hypothetical protein
VAAVVDKRAVKVVCFGFINRSIEDLWGLLRGVQSFLRARGDLGGEV